MQRRASWNVFTTESVDIPGFGPPASPGRARRRRLQGLLDSKTGDFQSLLDVLAPDVVMVADGGGVKQAALRPVIGAEKVVRMVVGGIGKAGVTLTADPTVINGNPALLLRVDGELDGVLAMRVEGSRITGIYYVRNPEKLSRVTSETLLTRRLTPEV
jgi:hypothetical protein